LTLPLLSKQAVLACSASKQSLLAEQASSPCLLSKQAVLACQPEQGRQAVVPLFWAKAKLLAWCASNLFFSILHTLFEACLACLHTKQAILLF